MSMRFRRRLLFGLGLIVVSGSLLAWYLRPDPQWAAAEQALGRRDYAAAYALLQDCLTRRRDDPSLLLLTGRTARRAGLFDQAAKHLNAYRRLKGEDPSFTLEWSLLRLQRGDAAVVSSLKAQARPGRPEALLIWEVLSQYYLDHYRLFEARDCLDRYLEQRPDDVAALLGRGFIWERLFHYAEAVRDYRRAVQVEPDNERAHLRLAETLAVTGPPEEAAEQFEWLRRRHPQDLSPRLGLARCWRQMGRTGEARQLLDALVAELEGPTPAPGAAGVFTERGRLALEVGELEQAAHWLRRAVALAPTDREALYNFVQCLQQSGQDAEAREYQARFQRADADLKRLGQLTKAVLRQPHDPALRCEVAALFLRNGQEQEGVRWLHLALSEAPDYGPAHQALADYYQQAGKLELAAHHRELARARRH
jgi:Flp pilus assembly protein TadD